jgi:hypothetical protein
MYAEEIAIKDFTSFPWFKGFISENTEEIINMKCFTNV